MTHDFTPKLGRIGSKHCTRHDRYINKIIRAAQTERYAGSTGHNGFTGADIGRSEVFGTLAGAGLYAGIRRRHA